MPLITLLKPGSLVFDDPDKSNEHKDTVPIEFIVEWFKKRRTEIGLPNRILILLSSTGSGKSTALPPRLFSEFIGKSGTGGNIIVTQPRVINAITIPKNQIAGSPHYSFMKLGENIGWQTGPSKKYPTFGLTYATVGVLIAQFKMFTDHEIMEKYKIIMIDEAHEASLELTSLLYTLKNFYMRNRENPNLPFLVIMSATIEPKKFIDYFELDALTNFIQVAGFAYELTERWDTAPVSVVNYISAAAETVKKIHLQGIEDPEDNRDILVFMPSPKEMKEAISRIKVLNAELEANGVPLLLPLLIDREAVNTNSDDYRLLFPGINVINSMNIRRDKLFVTAKKDKYAKNKDTIKRGGKDSKHSAKIFRRVIFGTSVLETGVTLDSLKYVCDSGYHRGPEFIPNYGAGGILTVPAPKSRIRQRAGRSNRKSPGEFWPLYPKYIYDSLQDDQMADIETSDISTIILTLMREQALVAGEQHQLNISDIDTIDKIPSDMIQFQLEKLYTCGFISPDCKYKFVEEAADIVETITDLPEEDEAIFGLTRTGQIASLFNNLIPEQIKLIMQSYLWECGTLDIITIAAYMGITYGEFKLVALEDISWAGIYNEGLPYYMTKGNAENVAYRAKLMIADDFISGLILFNALGRVMSQNVEDLGKVEEWCEKHKLRYSTCIEFIANREDIIDQMLQIGLNPFQGPKLSTDIQEADFMNYIVRIKHCILDAYRMNIAKYRDGVGYVLSNGVNVGVPPLVAIDESKLRDEKRYGVGQKGKPTYIICEGFSIKMQRAKKGGNETPTTLTTPAMYTIKSVRISALDGYVDADPEFI